MPPNRTTAQTPRISVALATYNGERFLQEQLDSLAQQTCKPYELVVTDDGSTDKTIEILNTFADQAPFPVHVNINEERLGYGDNFLKAASLCKGDWIAFCDQDDVWLPAKLETVAYAIRRRPSLNCVIHDALATDELLRVRGTRWRHRVNWIFRSRVAAPLRFSYREYPGFCLVVRSEVINLVPVEMRPRYLDGRRMPHDSWVTLLAYILGNTKFLSSVLALYRRHQSAETAGYAQGAIAKLTRLSTEKDCRFRQEAEGRRHLSHEIETLVYQAPESYRSSFVEGGAQFRRLAAWADKRARIYEAPSRVAKLVCLTSALIEGCYAGSLHYRTKGFGALAFVKDTLRVILD